MKKSIFWFRRDLRLQDNHGLFKALNESDYVACVFVFGESPRPEGRGFLAGFIH